MTSPNVSPMVLWSTGLSGAGKTTLAIALRDILKPRFPQTILIDGDTIRDAFGKSLGYAESDRVTQITRVQRLAKILADQGLIVIVAALYCHPDLLQWNRQNLAGYFEIYLEASQELLHRRDQNNLYSMAKKGETKNVVGIDIPWHAPQAPDLLLSADEEEPPQQMAHRVLLENPALSKIFGT
jgi:adenylylsulfate kinase-like enzyme